MRANVFRGVNKFGIEEVEQPRAQVGEAIVRVTLTTICGTDLHIVRGEVTGEFQDSHPAIGRRMTGGIRFAPDGNIESLTKQGEEPHLGEILFFSNGKLGEELSTSALRAVARPPAVAVREYRL